MKIVKEMAKTPDKCQISEGDFCDGFERWRPRGPNGGKSFCVKGLSISDGAFSRIQFSIIMKGQFVILKNLHKTRSHQRIPYLTEQLGTICDHHPRKVRHSMKNNPLQSQFYFLYK
jgi:hypothetical protein